jgi:small subunit ribosomal protein S33
VHQTSIQRPKSIAAFEIKHVKMSVPRARLLDLMKVNICDAVFLHTSTNIL